jgi:ubiquitin-conjugating enzyme E2 Z
LTSYKRLIRDLQILHNSAEQNMFFVDSNSNLNTIDIILIGPEDTPYEGGFFWIQIIPSERYPYVSPKAQYMSPVNGLRIHPNLYCDGKICLSILGTWSGPPWTSLLNFETIGISIQSLLNNNPIINEPGNENISVSSIKSQSYNKVVKYTTLFSIIKFLKNEYKISSDLQNKITEYISKNLDKYNKLFNEIKDFGIYNTEHHIHYYGLNNVKLNFTELYNTWVEIYNNLKATDI